MYTLPPLTYAYNALEPFISEETLTIHHDKLHQAYTDKLNKALADYPDLAAQPIEELLIHSDTMPPAVITPLINQGGGYFNHCFLWTSITPNSTKEPVGHLKDAINQYFGDFETFKQRFKGIAIDTFGSGWTWLVKNNKGELEILSTSKQDSPLLAGFKPLMVIDVWEHAYFLDYKNLRPNYIDQWWNIVNWENAETLFNA